MIEGRLLARLPTATGESSFSHAGPNCLCPHWPKSRTTWKLSILHKAGRSTIEDELCLLQACNTY